MAAISSESSSKPKISKLDFSDFNKSNSRAPFDDENLNPVLDSIWIDRFGQNDNTSLDLKSQENMTSCLPMLFGDFFDFWMVQQ